MNQSSACSGNSIDLVMLICRSCPAFVASPPVPFSDGVSSAGVNSCLLYVVEYSAFVLKCIEFFIIVLSLAWIACDIWTGTEYNPLYQRNGQRHEWGAATVFTSLCRSALNSSFTSSDQHEEERNLDFRTEVSNSFHTSIYYACWGREAMSFSRK